MNCRLAVSADLSSIMKLIQQAKDFLKSNGVDQWQDGYPDESCIDNDIRSGNGYVLTEEDRIIGYACISFDGEEAYQSLKGQWLSIQPYAVIHRMTIDNTKKGKGLAKVMFRFAEDLCKQKNVHSIKIDTDQDNAIMRHILTRDGYQFCGDIRFQNSDKIAFEKLL